MPDARRIAKAELRNQLIEARYYLNSVLSNLADAKLETKHLDTAAMNHELDGMVATATITRNHINWFLRTYMGGE